METINKKLNYIFIILLTLSILYLSSTNIRIVGEISLLLLLFLSMVLLIINLIFIKSVSKKTLLVFISSGIFLLVICISAFSLNDFSDSLYKIGTYIASISFFLYFIIANFTRRQLKFLFWSTFIISFIPFLNFIFNTDYFFNIINSNGIGMLLSFPLFLSVMLLQKEKKYLILTLFLLVLILFTVTRSVILGLAFSLIFYFILSFIKNRNSIILLILGIYYLIYNSLIFYINLKSKSYFSFFNELSMEYAGKNLLSGREEIWQHAILKINEKILLGYGIGTDISEIFGINLSLHNFYIQLTLQSGIIGLISFLLLIILIFNSYYEKNIDAEQKIAISFFAGYLIQQNFEVFLFENNLLFGLLILITASLALSINTKTERSVKT